MKTKIVRLSLIGMFAAFIFVATMFIRIPAFTGYFNCGDGIILFSAMYLGYDAIISASLGSALSDILSGYVIYAPATLIIKALMTFIAILLLHRIGKNRFGKIISFSIAEIIMVGGYFVYDSIIYSFAGALYNIGSNVLQAIVAVILALILSYVKFPFSFEKNRSIK
ncbi:MAG: ECF transporter S component [Oscillospiraceae bacterium]|nr:ECF transporter S component [Oscillospiraceae bacterium]